MRHVPCLCRTATNFAADGSLDEPAQSGFLERLVQADIGLYLGSGGSGEGHSLTGAEMRRLFDIGLEVGRGRVQVNANPPEQHSVAATVALATIAADCGVDVVNIYSPAGLHGFRASEDEVLDFYDQVFREIRYPVALGPGPIIGYSPKAKTVAEVCNRHSQVVAVNLAGLGDGYFVELKDALRRDIDIYVPYTGARDMIALGAAGILGPEANILPITFRRYMDALRSDLAGPSDEAYAEIKRFNAYVKAWHSGSPRWLKMAMRALGLPGAHLRQPYLMPPQEELDRFAHGLFALNVRELTAREV